MTTNNVPCNGCTRCCHNDLIRLLPSDDPTQYRTIPHPYRRGAKALAHKPDGDCVYLGKNGCIIHATKPQMCREMDCRRIALALSWTQARKLGAQRRISIGVWRRGKELLRELNGEHSHG